MNLEQEANLSLESYGYPSANPTAQVSTIISHLIPKGVGNGIRKHLTVVKRSVLVGKKVGGNAEGQRCFPTNSFVEA